MPCVRPVPPSITFLPRSGGPDGPAPRHATSRHSTAPPRRPALAAARLFLSLLLGGHRAPLPHRRHHLQAAQLGPLARCVASPPPRARPPARARGHRHHAHASAPAPRPRADALLSQLHPPSAAPATSPSTGKSRYAASKALQLVSAGYWAAELADKGVDVVAVSPGAFFFFFFALSGSFLLLLLLLVRAGPPPLSSAAAAAACPSPFSSSSFGFECGPTPALRSKQARTQTAATPSRPAADFRPSPRTRAQASSRRRTSPAHRRPPRGGPCATSSRGRRSRSQRRRVRRVPSFPWSRMLVAVALSSSRHAAARVRVRSVRASGPTGLGLGRASTCPRRLRARRTTDPRGRFPSSRAQARPASRGASPPRRSPPPPPRPATSTTMSSRLCSAPRARPPAPTPTRRRGRAGRARSCTSPGPPLRRSRHRRA